MNNPAMTDRLKKLFGEEHPPSHKVVKCKAEELASEAGPKYALLMGANLYDASAADVFIDDLVELFKVYRMLCHPETSVFIVTVLGDCDVSDLVSRWRRRVSEDGVATLWMMRMDHASIGVSPFGSTQTPIFDSIRPENVSPATVAAYRKSPKKPWWKFW